ncbi:MAG TPA: Re/Si-specific NAD(P)(+) transhydrogenase subunit alpha [Actinomycetota bacterium]|nr:Re/Si-specific NAD(P)(+) transhydrogenase subunit alpha [Actinomycetota bacterium]
MAEDRQLTVGVPAETFPGEARVALVPGVLQALSKAGMKTIVESGAGEAAGFPDFQYSDKGATVGSRADAFNADVVVQVQTFGSNPQAGKEDLPLLKKGQVVIGFTDPLGNPQGVQEMAKTGATILSVELMPRITRAQSMDVLSSQATVGGYKAVLVAAAALPKMFPMLTTAAGTIRPAKVFVIGAGVAGLQAIATAKRLGAVVEAYDVRPAVKEQVVSVGAKFVEMDLDTSAAEDKGGYAKEQGEEFIRKQRELMMEVVMRSDVVITTAAIPGRKSPVLITKEMVEKMQPGSAIVDLAAERGGNCELTRANETLLVNGVTIMGPTNLPATVPYHASSMYAKNLVTFLTHLVKDGAFKWDMEDQITVETLLARDGEVVLPRLREALGLGAATAATAETPGPAPAGTAELKVGAPEGSSNGSVKSENATT